MLALLAGTVVALIVAVVLIVASRNKASGAPTTAFRQIYRGNPADINDGLLAETDSLIANYDMLKQQKDELVTQLMSISEPQAPATSAAFDIGKNLQDIEHRQQIEQRIAEIEEQLKEIDGKLFILDKVDEHLRYAGMQMYRGYIPKARKLLDENLEKFAKKDFVSYDDTATISVNDVKGSWYSISAGERDLLNLCLRKTIADCLFTKEKPLMILDDPLVNLDEKNIAAGRDMIQRMAGEGQILYLTCHRDRLV